MSNATDADRSTTPKAIEDCHCLLVSMLPQLDKFSNSRRFTLSSPIEDGFWPQLAQCKLR